MVGHLHVCWLHACVFHPFVVSPSSYPPPPPISYRLKFPELESLVHNPVDYARVVKVIGNEMDITDLDLESILPPAAVMVITVTATTTSGKPLLQDDLDKVVWSGYGDCIGLCW